jgi:uncharacterized protein (TIGR02265 family)
MKVKGVILYARREFVLEHFGKEGWERVLGALPEADRELLQGSFFAAQWYPFKTGERLDHAIVKVLGGGDENVFEDIGAKSAQRALSKEHKYFLTPGDPQAFMRRAGTIYDFYYDTGYREYEQAGPNSAVLTTYEAETYSAADCLTVVGWYKEALKMCGATHVEATEEECRAKGGSCCRYRFRWEM